MITRLYSAQTNGLTPEIITVEVDISRGLHSFTIVGLPDKVVEESRERINAAVKNSGYRPPRRGNKRVTVSLAPADTKKEGPLFDLAIAIGTLGASGDLKFRHEDRLFIGELGLSGELRPIKGALLIAVEAKNKGIKEIFLPIANAKEAALIDGIKIYGSSSLGDVINHIKTKEGESEKIQLLNEAPKTKLRKFNHDFPVDFAHVKGQETAKRGLEIAAAGGHNVAMVGPPGTGKTLLAKAFPGILPDLTFNEVIEVTGIHSAAGSLDKRGLITSPPFKSPHHTSSYVSLVGGGTWPKPGEITLAHRGVLFLDEFPEFEKRVIESMRQPLEDKVISISRIKDSVIFPADFILVAAMNMCPCGNTGLSKKECVCSPGSFMKYKRKISGPITDRIDLWLSVPEVPIETLENKEESESSAKIRERVEKARDLQKNIFIERKLKLRNNASAQPREIKDLIQLGEEQKIILRESAIRLGISARSYHKILKIAQTIANLEGKKNIENNHLLESFQYRPKENFV